MRVANEVMQQHPGTVLGVMAVTGLGNALEREAWHTLREGEIESFRAAWVGYERKKAILRQPLISYAAYYKQFKKTYPVLLQIESVLLKGRSVQATSLPVETMFMAEVKHGLLAAGHDMALLSGDYTLNLAQGGEDFTVVTGQSRILKTNDIFMADGGRILSSVLEGQDYHTRLTEQSTSALYCVYGVGGVPVRQLGNFFQDLTRYLLTAFPLASIGEAHFFVE